MRCGIQRVKFAFSDIVAAAKSRDKHRQLLQTRLYTNSVFLLGNSSSTAILSLVFWIIVSRTYSPEAVGLGSALISVGLLLAFVANMGLNFGIIRFLPSSGPDRSNSSRLINSCFTLTGIVAIVSALVFLAALPLLSPSLIFIRERLFLGLTFVIFVFLRAVFNLLTPIYVARRRAEYSFIQAAVAGVLRIVIVVLLVNWLGAYGIFASWGLVTGLMLLTGLIFFLPRLEPGYRPGLTASPGETRRILSFSFGNYISSGLWYLPTWLLPLVVLNSLGQQANGYFFISWAIASHLFAIPLATSQSLFSEGANYEQFLARDTKRSLGFMVMLLAPSVALVVTLADKLLLIFGSEYSVEGRRLLQLLAVSALPTGVNLLYLGIARVQNRLKNIIAVSATIAIATLVLSYLLIPYTGLIGPGISWLLGNVLAALVTVPGIIKATREKGRASPLPSV